MKNNKKKKKERKLLVKRFSSFNNSAEFEKNAVTSFMLQIVILRELNELVMAF